MGTEKKEKWESGWGSGRGVCSKREKERDVVNEVERREVEQFSESRFSISPH
jgi:hypothetical protein